MPPGGGIPQQLANFNDLRFHGLSWFYAKTLSFGATLNLFAFGGPAFGPFTVNFVCDSTNGASLQAQVYNSNSYPITVHGFSVSGDSVNAQQLNSGESTTVKLFASATNGGSLASNARGSLLTSNGYYLGIDTDGFLLSAGATGMPNSDCSLAGYIYYAHPHGGGYYTGLLSSNLDFSSTSSSSSPTFFTGLILGLVLGNIIIVATVFMIVKNRSLLMHSLGFNQLIPSNNNTTSFSCLPLDDQTTHETPSNGMNPIHSTSTSSSATSTTPSTSAL